MAHLALKQARKKFYSKLGYSYILVRLANSGLLLIPHTFALFFRSCRTVTKSQKVNKTVFYEGKSENQGVFCTAIFTLFYLLLLKMLLLFH